MITTIIFDFGGVISTWDPFTRVSENFEKKYGIKKELFYNLLKKNDNEYLLGNITTKDFWEKTAKLKGVSYEEFYREISLFKLDPIMIKLIGKLKKKYELIMLSDCYEAIHEKMKKNLDIQRLFSHGFFSDDLHISKAVHKEEIFKFVLNKIKKKASECVFIDDKKVHVESAERAGIKAILFSSPTELSTELKLLKLLD